MTSGSTRVRRQHAGSDVVVDVAVERPDVHVVRHRRRRRTVPWDCDDNTHQASACQRCSNRVSQVEADDVDGHPTACFGLSPAQLPEISQTARAPFSYLLA
jgi:hypothetical protein